MRKIWLLVSVLTISLCARGGATCTMVYNAVDVNTCPGAPDLGAQINAADAFLGSGTAGEIWVTKSGTISTAQVNLSSGHDLWILAPITVTLVPSANGVINAPGNNWIWGAGASATVTVNQSTPGTIIYVPANANNVTVQGIYAVASTPSTSYILVNTSATVNLKVLDNTTNGMMLLFNGGTSSDTEVSRNTVVGGISWGPSTNGCIDIGPGVRVVVANNVIHACGDAIELWGGDANPTHGGYTGIPGLTDVVASGNTINGGSLWGGEMQRVVYANNTVTGSGDVNIDCEGCVGAIYTGNVSQDGTNADYSLYFRTRDARLVGNVAIASGGVASGTYTSGGTISGSAGQTCTLSSFNGGGSGTTAAVALTGSNVIASGTWLTVTAVGSGYTSAPTSATLSNGTASCSGTATVSTTIAPTYGLFWVTGNDSAFGNSFNVELDNNTMDCQIASGWCRGFFMTTAVDQVAIKNSQMLNSSIAFNQGSPHDANLEGNYLRFTNASLGAWAAIGVYGPTGTATDQAKVIIKDNTIDSTVVQYTGSEASYIYHIDPNYSENDVIQGNWFGGAHPLPIDIYLNTYNTSTNINADISHNMLGSSNAQYIPCNSQINVWLDGNTSNSTGTMLPWPGAAPTTTGGCSASGAYYSVGEFIANSAPASGGIFGWVSTTAGSPGTWSAVPISTSRTNPWTLTEAATSGALPTCSVTGFGGASCVVYTGSNDTSGYVYATAATGSGSSGEWTLTFHTTLATNYANCVWNLASSGAGVYNARATIIVDSTCGAGACTSTSKAAWDNNGVALTSGVIYRANYVCLPW
jgi:hypothetical protein